MPYSQHLLNFERSLYPESDKCDYYRTHRTIINHFYEQFFTRLRENKYQFPSADFYNASFGESLQTNFLIDSRPSIYLSPPSGYKWLVFVHTAAGLTMYVARYVESLPGHVQLFGRSPGSACIKVDDEGVTVTGVAIPDGRILGMERDGVKFL